MENIDKLIDELHLDNQLLLEEMPDLGLYMDQVIQIFENKLAKSKRHDDEKVLTKTMINNYAKGKLFFPIQNKKYSKKHLILISLIYHLKGALSIHDIKVTLDQLNAKVVEEDLDVEQIYRSYLKLSHNNVERFIGDIKECKVEVSQEVSEFENEDSNYLEQVLLIASLVNMSNYYRKLAEKLVDGLPREKVEKDKVKENKK